MRARSFKAGAAPLKRSLGPAIVALFMATAPLGLLAADPASAQGVSTGSVSAFGDATPYGSPAGSQLNGPTCRHRPDF
jgi:hypothetical protein